MNALTHSTSVVVPKAASRPRRRTGPWQKAMARFQDSLKDMKAAGEIHDAAEEATFAARRALEQVQPPASLTGLISIEFYFNDGMRKPILRRYVDELKLHDEKTIVDYTKDDKAKRGFLLNELRTWQDRRLLSEIALAEASATEEVTNKAWCTAIAKSDAQQLRVLRTPAPTLRELQWKIEMLRKADCNDHTEKAGWAYVMSELAMLAASADSETKFLN